MHTGIGLALTTVVALGGLVRGMMDSPPASAQTTAPLLDMPQAPMPSVIYPECQPPSAREHLLLVVTPTPESMEAVQKSFPSSVSLGVCTYQEAVVTRVGGFTSQESAASWVRYMRDTKGLTAYVVQPVATVATPPSPTPSQPTRRPSAGYDPQPLGAGYAVLVDFQNKPELAAKLQQATGRDVGLVAYQQRPYLLATYTTELSNVNELLKVLGDRGFWSIVVDGRRVVLLRQAIDTAALSR